MRAYNYIVIESDGIVATRNLPVSATCFFDLNKWEMFGSEDPISEIVIREGGTSPWSRIEFFLLSYRSSPVTEADRYRWENANHCAQLLGMVECDDFFSSKKEAVCLGLKRGLGLLCRGLSVYGVQCNGDEVLISTSLSKSSLWPDAVFCLKSQRSFS